jgi:hypothetical protein
MPNTKVIENSVNELPPVIKLADELLKDKNNALHNVKKHPEACGSAMIGKINALDGLAKSYSETEAMYNTFKNKPDNWSQTIDLDGKKIVVKKDKMLEALENLKTLEEQAAKIIIDTNWMINNQTLALSPGKEHSYTVGSKTTTVIADGASYNAALASIAAALENAKKQINPVLKALGHGSITATKSDDFTKYIASLAEVFGEQNNSYKPILLSAGKANGFSLGA